MATNNKRFLSEKLNFSKKNLENKITKSNETFMYRAKKNFYINQKCLIYKPKKCRQFG